MPDQKLEKFKKKQKKVEVLFRSLKDQIPYKIRKEIIDLFESWRMKYFFLGIYPTSKDIFFLKRLNAKLIEIKGVS